MILDKIDHWQCYAASPAWAAAFGFAAGFDPSLPDGEYPLQGRDIYASVFSYATKQPGACLLEAHRRYADFQFLLSGSELHGRCSLDGLRIRTAYDPDRDAEFYEHPEHHGLFLMRPGMFALYLPQDAHITQMQTGPENGAVRKMVVKVRVGLLLPRQS